MSAYSVFIFIDGCGHDNLKLFKMYPPPQKLARTRPQTHVKATSEAWPQTGEVDQSITSLLQQSNKVIIRQRLADLERPGQSKPAVM